MADVPPARRPLRSRERAWTKSLAARLARAGVSPNAISIASIGFAAVTAAGLVLAHRGGALSASLALLLAAAAIQLRLLCNLIDGMVAIEGGRATRTGGIYNEVPDRIADVMILVAAGYGVAVCPWAPTLGWLAALMAVTTAYVRLLGGTFGLPQDFHGPMAKQHRMAVMTGACLAGIGEILVFGTRGWVLLAALLLIAAGSLLTAARRLRRMIKAMNTSGDDKQ